MIVVDTSATVKLLVEEDESGSVEDLVRECSEAGTEMVVSQIGVTELRRAAVRLALAPDSTEAVIGLFSVVRLSEAVLQLAGRLPYRSLGTLDALHLSTALVLEADAVVTYDERLADAVRAEGIEVLHPGRG